MLKQYLMNIYIYDHNFKIIYVFNLNLVDGKHI